MKMLLGGFRYENSERVQFEPIESPSKSSLLNLLSFVEKESGVLGLEQESLNEFGANELTLYSENGHYLVMYGCYDDDGDYLVSTLKNEKNLKSEMMNILGEVYPASSVVEDFNFIKDVFVSFLLSGKPSESLR